MISVCSYLIMKCSVHACLTKPDFISEACLLIWDPQSLSIHLNTSIHTPGAGTLYMQFFKLHCFFVFRGIGALFFLFFTKTRLGMQYRGP